MREMHLFLIKTAGIIVGKGLYICYDVPENIIQQKMTGDAEAYGSTGSKMV